MCRCSLVYTFAPSRVTSEATRRTQSKMVNLLFLR